MNLGGVSIIAVDDDPVVTGVLRRIFRGARSFEAFGGAEEFLAEARLDACDVVFTDINMPGGRSGIELTAHIRRVAPQCDVIVVTGEPTLDNALGALKAGAYDFIQKPFTAEAAEAVLERCMQKRALSGELRLLKAAQEELSAAYSQLSGVDRMKDAFLSVVGHELRTPLTKILGGCELLRGAVAPDLEEVVRAVSAGAADLHRSIEEIILYSELSKEAAPAVLEPVDLDAAAAAAAGEQAPKAAAAGMTLVLRTSEVPAVVLGDRSRLEGAVLRLVRNAVVYGAAGGAAEVSVSADSDTVSVSVADSGIGVPAELASGLGAPFYQIAEHMTRRTGGLGLGLAIVRKVTDAHRGRLSVRGNGESGTVFTMILPKRPPEKGAK